MIVPAPRRPVQPRPQVAPPPDAWTAPMPAARHLQQSLYRIATILNPRLSTRRRRV
jgi:hypothetical protein